MRNFEKSKLMNKKKIECNSPKEQGRYALK